MIARRAATPIAIAIAIGIGVGIGGCDRASSTGPDPRAAAATTAQVAALPGAIWFVDGDDHGPPTRLVRLAGGVRTEVGDDGDGRSIWPSRWLLPDGALVGIASRADGGPDGEQLVTVGPDGKVAAVGAPALQIREPAVDPGGAWIVAATMIDRISELYRYDLPSGARIRITDDKEGNFHPATIARGAIAFVSSRDGDAELYRADPSGRHARRLTAFHKDDWEPVVAPDGQTIAFLSDREGVARIFVMAPDGTGQRRLTDRAGQLDEADATWSPDGTRIAYRVGAQVWLRDVAAGTERAVTPDGARDDLASFSPDGGHLAVARDGAVWAIPVDGAPPFQLAARGRMPRWVAR